MFHIAALPAEFTIYTVSDLRRQWLESLAEDKASSPAGAADGRLSLDGSAVEVIDGAGLQALIALSHSLRHRQLCLEIVHASAHLDAACRALRLEALLMGQSVEATGATA